MLASNDTHLNFNNLATIRNISISLYVHCDGEHRERHEKAIYKRLCRCESPLSQAIYFNQARM